MAAKTVDEQYEALVLPPGVSKGLVEGRRMHLRVTFLPHPSRVLSGPLEFDLRLPQAYPRMPPAVSYDEASPVVAALLSTAAATPLLRSALSGGRVTLKRLDGTSSEGWSADCTLSVVVAMLNLLLRRPEWVCVTPIDPAPTTSFGFGPAPRFTSGEHADQGRRPSMEDRAVAVDSMVVGGGVGSVALWCVFDGHGGDSASAFAAGRLPTVLFETLASGADPTTALRSTFMQVDAEFAASIADVPRKRPGSMLPGAEDGGTTAVVVLYCRGGIYVANVGDSRALMCRGGRCVALSVDHKASVPEEVARVLLAGGFVVSERVMGRIAVSRAIGDLSFKAGHAEGAKPMLTAEPEIMATRLVDGDEFIILACDGLFDVMKNEEAVDFVRERLKRGLRPSAAAAELTAEALRLWSLDNVSVVVVQIAGVGDGGSARFGAAAATPADTRMTSPVPRGSFDAAAMPDAAIPSRVAPGAPEPAPRAGGHSTPAKLSRVSPGAPEPAHSTPAKLASNPAPAGLPSGAQSGHARRNRGGAAAAGGGVFPLSPAGPAGATGLSSPVPDSLIDELGLASPAAAPAPGLVSPVGRRVGTDSYATRSRDARGAASGGGGGGGGGAAGMDPSLMTFLMDDANFETPAGASGGAGRRK